ncbi:hypothetical protein V496_05599 [Pseudogymnoascus sp. VKM F-4515 (FW-2607)]|nr:hypothetical protein V496_05599 [Pseudogymnoascus sp. VKM F-4515 (FW-2607)]
MLFKASTIFAAFTLTVAFEGESDTPILKASGFEGSISPFSECNHKSPSYSHATSESPIHAGSGKLTVYFDESNYDGTRDDKETEICYFNSGTTTNSILKKEGYQGFALYVPSSSFPTDKSTILVVDHRSSCGDPTQQVVVSSIARDTWHSVIVRFKVSATERGAYEVWYNGNNVYSSKNINVGFGDSWTDDILTSGFYFKNGQYAYDTENYNDGTRTLYFDNVSWYDVSGGQTDGRTIVDPA